MIIGLVVRVKVAVKEVKAPVVGNREGIALPIDTAIEGVTAVIEGIAEVLLVAVAVAKAVAVAEVMV